jgi:serine/threonine-protein kinase
MFADDVRRFLRGEPILARPVGRLERAVSWARRRPAAAALLGVSGAAIVAVLGISLAYNARLKKALDDTAQERDRADRNYESTKEQREHADHNFRKALEAVNQMLTEVAEGDLANAPYMEAARRRLLERALAFFEEFSQQKAGDPGLRLETARAQERVAQILSLLGRLPEAEQTFAKARALVDELAAEEPQNAEYRHQRFVIYNSSGILQGRSGHFSAALDFYREALADIERLAKEFPENATYTAHQATCYSNQGQALESISRYADAEKALGRAVELGDQLAAEHPDIPSIDHANNLRAFGVLQDYLHQPKKAETPLRQSIEILERGTKKAPENPEWKNLLGKAHNSLALVLENLNRYDEAAKEFEKALEYKRALASDFPRVPEYQSSLANTLNSVGIMYRERRESSKAEASFREALAIRDRIAAEETGSFESMLSVAGSCCNIGMALSDQEKFEPSLPYFERAIKTLNELLVKEPRLAQAKNFLRNSHQARARVYMALGRYPEAIADWDKAVEFDPGPFRPAYRSLRALALAHTGDFGQALAQADELRKVPNLHGQPLFELACVYSLAAGALEKGSYKPPDGSRTAKQCVEDAIALLKLAARRQYLHRVRLEKDTDLDPLRGRDEFREYLAGLKSGSGR